MARTAATPQPSAETLGAVIEEQISCCRSILAATEAVEAALDALDADALDGAVAQRSLALARLSELETEARGPKGTPPSDLAPRLASLQDLVRRVRRADERARQAAERSLGRLKRRIQGVNEAQRGLRGYRGPVDPLPRFADRRG